jgi:hypothetical protein
MHSASRMHGKCSKKLSSKRKNVQRNTQNLIKSTRSSKDLTVQSRFVSKRAMDGNEFLKACMPTDDEGGCGVSPSPPACRCQVVVVGG